MNDSHIRAALIQELSIRYANDSQTLIVEELALKHGATRIDIAVINDQLYGYEIKSAKDTLIRLPDQARIYSSVLDRITLVVAYCHAYEALQIIPDWWGVELVHMGPEGVVISEARDPRDNPMIDKSSIAELLWRDEAIAFLEEMDAANGVRSKSRSVIYKRIVEVADLQSLRSRVCRQLRLRTDWRPDLPQVSSGD